MLYFLCVLRGFLSFCPLLGEALLSLPDINNHTHFIKHSINNNPAGGDVPITPDGREASGCVQNALTSFFLRIKTGR